jgi:hypothetical protein
MLFQLNNNTQLVFRPITASMTTSAEGSQLLSSQALIIERVRLEFCLRFMMDRKTGVVEAYFEGADRC